MTGLTEDQCSDPCRSVGVRSTEVDSESDDRQPPAELCGPSSVAVSVRNYRCDDHALWTGNQSTSLP